MLERIIRTFITQEYTELQPGRWYTETDDGFYGVEIDEEKQELRWYDLQWKPEPGEDWDNRTDTQTFEEFLENNY